MIRFHNTETDEIIDREMTDAEYEQYQAELKAYADANEARESVKAQKAALLERLGITENEAKLLLA
jgi:cell shape-determining protein MreC